MKRTTCLLCKIKFVIYKTALSIRLETDLCRACSVFLSGGRGGRTSSCLIPDKTGMRWRTKLLHFTTERFTKERKRKGSALKLLICKISKQPFISIDAKVNRQ